MQLDRMEGKVDALPTRAEYLALKATVDDLPTRAEFKATVDELRRELFVIVVVLALFAFVIVVVVLALVIQKRWSDETKRHARFNPAFVNDRCSSPASRSYCLPVDYC